MNKLKALSKLIIKNTLDNKVVFIYTLVFPGFFFLYMNINLLTSNTALNLFEISKIFMPYWSYIIVVNILNNVVMETLSYRESGFYKIMTYVIGNKFSMYFSILLVQLFLTLIQLMSFTIIFMMLIHSFHFELIVHCIVLLLITYLPVNLFLFQIINYKLKKDTIGIFSTMVLFLMFFLLKFDNQNLFLSVLIYLNPLKYTNSVAAYLVNLVDPIYNVNIFALIITSCIFMIIGVFNLKLFSINPYENRI